MICSPEAQQELLSSATETRTTQPVVPTWKQHVYSCRYIYGTGMMVLSVKELANKSETDDYVASLEHRLGVSRRVRNLGEDSFVTTDGSAVVRKDFKVLLVDVSKLPRRFGPSSDTREGIALNVAATIMGCWTGA